MVPRKSYIRHATILTHLSSLWDKMDLPSIYTTRKSLGSEFRIPKWLEAYTRVAKSLGSEFRKL